jgi:uncharacterized protein (TIGR00369 family)
VKTFTTRRGKTIQTPDPNFEQKIRDSFPHVGVMRALGGQLVTVAPGLVEIHRPFSEMATQQHGFFHGGIVATIADSASGYAAYTVLEADEEVLSAEFKINFLSPARGEKLIAQGSVIKAGRTLVITESVVCVVRDGEQIECGLMMHTLARVKHVRSGRGNG